jgi:hypothetical protein
VRVAEDEAGQRVRRAVEHASSRLAGSSDAAMRACAEAGSGFGRLNGAAAATLATALQSPCVDARIVAAFAVASRGSWWWRRRVASCLVDDAAQVRAALVLGLRERSGAQRWRLLLLARLVDDESDVVAALASNALRDGTRGVRGWGQWQDIVSRQLQDPRPRAVARALWVLEGGANPERLRTRLTRAIMRLPAPEARRRLTEVVMRTGPAPARYMARILELPVHFLAHEYATAIREMGEAARDALPCLRQYMRRSSRPELQRVAAMALVGLGEDGVHVLERAGRSWLPSTRRAVALGLTDGPAVPVELRPLLARLAEDRSSRVREAARRR